MTPIHEPDLSPATKDRVALVQWLREQEAKHAANEATFVSEYQRGIEWGMAAAYRIVLAKIGG